MKRIIFIVAFLIILGFSVFILINIREVNEYWNNQMEITNTDSLNLHVTETKYLRGYLSFNQDYYILDAKVSKSNIELWEVTELTLPFTIRKENNNDTLKLWTNKNAYYFLLDNK